MSGLRGFSLRCHLSNFYQTSHRGLILLLAKAGNTNLVFRHHCFNTQWTLQTWRNAKSPIFRRKHRCINWALIFQLSLFIPSHRNLDFVSPTLSTSSNLRKHFVPFALEGSGRNGTVQPCPPTTQKQTPENRHGSRVTTFWLVLVSLNCDEEHILENALIIQSHFWQLLLHQLSEREVQLQYSRPPEHSTGCSQTFFTFLTDSWNKRRAH